jgi:hypothetical protein
MTILWLQLIYTHVQYTTKIENLKCNLLLLENINYDYFVATTNIYTCTVYYKNRKFKM